MGVLLCYFFILLLKLVLANRISESIYEDLDAKYTCFTILNATHEFGCHADFSGNVGLLRVVTSRAELDALLASEEHQPLVVMLSRQQFTVQTLQKLEDMTADTEKGDVKGVLLMLPDSSLPPEAGFSFSDDQHCPNRASSFYRPDQPEYQYCESTPWNPAGTGMFKRHWTFPIMLMKNETQIRSVIECHHNHSAAWPRCAVEMSAFMAAAGNAEICWRRSNAQYIRTKPTSFCSPMGSKNVYGTWLPRGGAAPPAADGATVLLAARADGFSMFDAAAPAADAAAVGMVALVSAARALAQIRPPDGVTVNVMFMLFSGESFDYIGSDRMVYDMAEGKFPRLSVPAEGEKEGSVVRPPPLTMADVRYYLELNQLARGPLYLHTDPVSRGQPAVNDKVEELLGHLANYSAQYGLSMSRSSQGTPLPPSSLHALLRANASLPGVVITDHNQQYTNNFYQSVYDDADTLGDTAKLVDKLAQLTQVVVSAVYNLAAGQRLDKEVNVDKQWLGDVVECYLVRSNCSLFRSVMNEPLKDAKDLWMADAPIPTYVSVAGAATLHYWLMDLTQNLLSRETGVVLQNVTKEEDCKDKDSKIYTYRWLLREDENGTRHSYCARSLVSASAAASPAFEMDDYDWSSGAHPTWAESRWVGFQLRLFLKPSLGHELAHLLLGLAVTLLAAGLVLLLERRADTLFSDAPRYELQS